MIAIVAAGECREVATVDIPGAYLHADMPSNCVVHMRLNKYLSKLMMQLNCDYANYLTDDGTVIVRLDKGGSYGCVQSAKLWYDRLCDLLMDLGYSVNTEDSFVSNRLREDNQTTICVHVVDLMITSKNKWDIDTAVKELKTAFGSVSVNRGKLQNYIGMVFDFTCVRKVTVNMIKYVEELQLYTEVKFFAPTPAE